MIFLGGMLLAVSTVRLFPKLGNGTPAPWDPTTKLIVTGPYAYVRNPMITGVVLILTSEALMLGSLAIGIWAVVFLIINMFYFPLSEEPGLRKRFGKEYDEYCKMCLDTFHASLHGNLIQHQVYTNHRQLQHRIVIKEHKINHLEL